MLDILVAAPSEVRIGERTYKVGALKLYEFGLLYRWIRDHVPRPEGIPPDAWPPPLPSRDGSRLIFEGLEGQLHFLGIFFRKHNPEITDADIEGIARAIDEVAFLTFWTIATGQDDLDPEAVGAAVAEHLRMLSAAAAPDATAPTTGPSSPTDG